MTAIMQTLLFMLAVLAAVASRPGASTLRRRSCWSWRESSWRSFPDCRRVALAPELVLLVILPPLIYSAGVAMSWREFRFNLRPITLLAFGCVVFTACAVAAAAHYLLGMSDWAVGFLLGAIVSPARRAGAACGGAALGLPRRLVGRAGRRRARQRRDRAHPLSLRGRGGRHRHLFASGSGRHVRADLRRRDRLGHRRRLAQPAAAPMGARSARGNHAVADDALPRVLGAGASRRLRRAGDGGLRALCELERAAA